MIRQNFNDQSLYLTLKQLIVPLKESGTKRPVEEVPVFKEVPIEAYREEAGVSLEAGPRCRQGHQLIAPVFIEVSFRAHWKAVVSINAAPRRSQLYWKLDPII